jgi:hypothetical protein
MVPYGANLLTINSSTQITYDKIALAPLERFSP